MVEPVTATGPVDRSAGEQITKGVRTWRFRILAVLAAVFTTAAVVVATPAYAVETPRLYGYRDIDFKGTVWSYGGTNTCFNLSGTTAMNQFSSIKGAYLKQWDTPTENWVYYRVDVYNHGDCTGYLMSLNGKTHGASDSDSDLRATCWCNDEISGIKIIRIY